jgi:hypothetical protein
MTTLHLVSVPNDNMSEDLRDDSPGRRATDGQMVRAADNAISIGWRWAQILATLIGFGFVAGIFYVKSDATTTALADLRGDMRDFSSELKSLRDAQQANAVVEGAKSERFQAMERLVNQQGEEIRELRGQLSEIRSMREAYVYSSAQRKNATVPP